MPPYLEPHELIPTKYGIQNAEMQNNFSCDVIASVLYGLIDHTGYQCCSRDLLVRDRDRDRDLSTRDRDKTETFGVRDQNQTSETETEDIRDRDRDRDLQCKSCVKGSRLGTFCP